MVMLAPTDIRSYVYEHLDIEADEISSAVLNVFMEDAYNEIVGFFDESPTWLHVEYTFTCVAGTQSYDLDTEADLIVPTPLQTITDVRGPRWTLKPVSHRQAREGYRQDTVNTGTSSEFSTWGRSLFLWPIPTADEVYTITGTRQPTDWLTLNDAPDCPQEFHRLIADYTLGRAYIQQDDPETGQVLLNAFQPALHRLATRYFDSNDAQPLVINEGRGNRDAYRTSNVLGPLIYTWE